MENKYNREKLVFKFTRGSILSCGKEEGLMKSRYEWKVSTLSSIHTNIVKENVEESINK